MVLVNVSIKQNKYKRKIENEFDRFNQQQHL